MSPFGLTLELEIRCPSGILMAFTIPPEETALEKTLQ